MNKVFGIGAPKTGTTSLAKALELLGFCHKTWDPKLHAEFCKGNFEAVFDVADKFDSFDDGPWNMNDFYKHLDKRYPNSKFILTARDANEWGKSHERHFSSNGDRRIPRKYWVYDYHRCKQTIIQQYEKRNNEVIDYFKRRPGDLLLINICAGEGWEKLCPFLGRSIPDISFPNINPRPRSLERFRAILKRILAGDVTIKNIVSGKFAK